jgi:hypothetical protein
MSPCGLNTFCGKRRRIVSPFTFKEAYIDLRSSLRSICTLLLVVVLLLSCLQSCPSGESLSSSESPGQLSGESGWVNTQLRPADVPLAEADLRCKGLTYLSSLCLFSIAFLYFSNLDYRIARELSPLLKEYGLQADVEHTAH